MESVGTKSYRQRSPDTVGFEAPAPHIVVVCPSCKTSFAVETAVVAALETPRFHCSRCDDIFIMKDAPADMLPLGGVNVQSLTHGGFPLGSQHNRARGPIPESLIKPSDFSLGTGGSAPKAFIEPNFDAPIEPPAEARSELSLLSRGVDDCRNESPIREEEMAFESPLAPPSSMPPTQKAIPTIFEERSTPTNGFLVTPVATPTTGPSSRQFVLADPPPTLPEHALSHNRTNTQTQLTPQPHRNQKATNPPSQVTGKSAPLSETESYRPAPQARHMRTQSTHASEARRFSARTQSLISMGAPILASLALLLGLSYCAQVSPQSVDALMNYLTPSVLKNSVQAPAPSSLAVKNPRLSLKKTRNRELIPVVTGTVMNASGRPFNDVELEVIGFNGRGEIIASSRAPLRSALANENVSDLSLETIARYQRAVEAKESSIKPKEVVPFKIALINGRRVDTELGTSDFDPSLVKYFSARIFSIERPR